MTTHHHPNDSKILICTPVRPDGFVHYRTVAFLVSIAERRPHWYSGWLSSCSPYIAINRDALVTQALQLPGITHILWLDSDVVPPENAVDRLLVHDKEIIGGIVPNLLPQKTPAVTCFPSNPQVEAGWMIVPQGEQAWRRWEGPPEGLVPCRLLATAFLLVSIEVFGRLPAPWFNQDNDTPEDVAFMNSLHDHAFTVWADCTIRCQHHKTCDLLEVFSAAK